MCCGKIGGGALREDWEWCTCGKIGSGVMEWGGERREWWEAERWNGGGKERPTGEALVWRGGGACDWPWLGSLGMADRHN